MKTILQKEQMEGAWEAMSWIIVQQENERQLDTIRARVMERSIWRQGRGIVRGTQSDGSKNVGIIQKCVEMRGSVRSCVKGGKSSLLSSGPNISARIMSAKLE